MRGGARAPIKVWMLVSINILRTRLIEIWVNCGRGLTRILLPPLAFKITVHVEVKNKKHTWIEILISENDLEKLKNI